MKRKLFCKLRSEDGTFARASEVFGQHLLSYLAPVLPENGWGLIFVPTPFGTLNGTARFDTGSPAARIPPHRLEAGFPLRFGLRRFAGTGS
jgi:hypothetical protein